MKKVYILLKSNGDVKFLVKKKKCPYGICVI